MMGRRGSLQCVLPCDVEERGLLIYLAITLSVQAMKLCINYSRRVGTGALRE